MVESTTDKYIIPREYQKKFKPEQQTELINSFKNYDKDSNGHMDKAEFKAALKDMGYRDCTDA